MAVSTSPESSTHSAASSRRRSWALVKRLVPAPLFVLASRLLPRRLKAALNRAVESSLGSSLERTLEAKAVSDIRQSRRTIPVATIESDLRALGFPRGAVVFVHSSLKTIGYIEGGAATIVDALCKVIVTEGACTLAMPAISIDSTMHAALAPGRMFDARTTPSTVGAITERFRQRPGVQRSVHPTHSVAALGDRARWLVGEHHTCGSTFGRGSPYARLLEADGFLMGLGTALGTVTFYHVLEDLTPDFPLNVYSADSPIVAACIDAEGRRHDVAVMAHDPERSRTRIDTPNGTWIREYFTAFLEGRGSLRWGRVGEAPTWMLRVRDLYAAQEELMRRGITIYSTRDEVEAIDGDSPRPDASS